LEVTCPDTKAAQAALKRFKREGGQKSLETAKKNYIQRQIQHKERAEQKDMAVVATQLKIKEAYDAVDKLVRDFSEVASSGNYGASRRVEVLKESVRPLAELCFTLS